MSISAMRKRLLAVPRLRDEQVVQVHAQPLRPARVERVLGVDERGHPAGPLRLRDGVQRDGRLAARLGPVDLDHAAARQALAAERQVEAQRAGRDAVDVQPVHVAERHDRALAELLLDRRERGLQLLARHALVLVLRLLELVAFPP
jgi:hypothetical protein